MEWISVKDRLPEEEKVVITCRYDGTIETKYYIAQRKPHCGGWYPGGTPFDNITHLLYSVFTTTLIESLLIIINALSQYFDSFTC